MAEFQYTHQSNNYFSTYHMYLHVSFFVRFFLNLAVLNRGENLKNLK